jgi:hypothetical protein
VKAGDHVMVRIVIFAQTGPDDYDVVDEIWERACVERSGFIARPLHAVDGIPFHDNSVEAYLWPSAYGSDWVWVQ